MGHTDDSSFIYSSQDDSFLWFIRLIIFKFQLLPIVLLVDDHKSVACDQKSDHTGHLVIDPYLLL